MHRPPVYFDPNRLAMDLVQVLIQLSEVLVLILETG